MHLTDRGITRRGGDLVNSLGGQRLVCLDFFFFSSRRRHTRLQGDWSSDVCSSDLHVVTVQRVFPNTPAEEAGVREGDRILSIADTSVLDWNIARVSDHLRGVPGSKRSEERRVGKECRSRWSPYH